MARRPRARIVALVVGVVLTLVVTALPAGAGTMAPDARSAVRPIVFPVLQLQRYRDNFQECRDGCRRLHEGTDVFGPRHSPLLASRDGTIVRLVTNTVGGGIYGNNILLRSDDGWTYLYSHLNNDNVGTDDGRAPRSLIVPAHVQVGARVSAGQVIGYIGDSGNAERSVPHVHYEIHNPRGEFINPYRSLVSAVRLSAPVEPSTVPGDQRAYLRALGIHFVGGSLTDVQRVRAYDLLRRPGGRDVIVRDLPRSAAWINAEIVRLYDLVLRRRPDAAGNRFWIAAVQNGMPLGEANAHFHSLAEYYARSGGNDVGWIDALYRDLLGRPSDGSGRAYWTGVLAGGASRLDVAYAFVQSPESRGVRVDRLYRRLLDRRPDRSGRAYWADVLATRDDLALASFLAVSDEYYARAPRV